MGFSFFGGTCRAYRLSTLKTRAAEKRDRIVRQGCCWLNA